MNFRTAIAPFANNAARTTDLLEAIHNMLTPGDDLCLEDDRHSGFTFFTEKQGESPVL